MIRYATRMHAHPILWSSTRHERRQREAGRGTAESKARGSGRRCGKRAPPKYSGVNIKHRADFSQLVSVTDRNLEHHNSKLLVFVRITFSLPNLWSLSLPLPPEAQTRLLAIAGDGVLLLERPCNVRDHRWRAVCAVRSARGVSYYTLFISNMTWSRSPSLSSLRTKNCARARARTLKHTKCSPHPSLSATTA